MLESKRRAIIFFTLSFLLALLAGFLFLKKIQEINAELGEMVEIYVAGTDIASRALIQPDQVTTRQIPKKYADDSYITDRRTLQNKVTVIPLSEGDIITKNMIKPASIVRDQNNRLVTVYASGKIIFDQQLEALDRVDVIVSHNVDGKPVTEVFMKDVPVAMVAKADDQFKGVALELPFEQVPAFIHQQHYADIIRILKANVGKGELGIAEPFQQPASEQPTAEQTGETKTEAGSQPVTQEEQTNGAVTVPLSGQHAPPNADTKPEGQR
ncbi:MAG: flagella basal body P-ring formation protein FlgA [Brevibacillus sp.]|nr:flagella basal body P-ring formation protein FlgA [Brevibacillus sp.]